VIHVKQLPFRRRLDQHIRFDAISKLSKRHPIRLGFISGAVRPRAEPDRPFSLTNILRGETTHEAGDPNSRRRSWKCTPCTRARRQVARHAVFTLAIGSPISLPKILAALRRVQGDRASANTRGF
jgi:hypothetical protein